MRTLYDNQRVHLSELRHSVSGGKPPDWNASCPSTSTPDDSPRINAAASINHCVPAAKWLIGAARVDRLRDPVFVAKSSTENQLRDSIAHATVEFWRLAERGEADVLFPRGAYNGSPPRPGHGDSPALDQLGIIHPFLGQVAFRAGKMGLHSSGNPKPFNTADYGTF